jgi:hypothetical protein
VVTADDIERIARYFLVDQSVATLRKDFHRWAGFLYDLGVSSLPRTPFVNDAAGGRAVDLISLLILQAAPHGKAKTMHVLRDVLGVRPYKS